jgi:outer membrane protein OmpA-like peptidoglycan-associated protein
MKTALLVFVLFLQMPLFAQNNEPIDIKEYFLDAEYFFAEEEYLDALYDYMEVYNNGYQENANINYRMGICYLNLPEQKDKSVPYLLEAVKSVSPKYRDNSLKQKTAPVDAYLYLGNAYRVNNMLSKAIEAYQKFKELTGSVEESKFADQQIAACNTAIRFMDNPVRISFTNLGDSVNGASSDYRAVISGDGKTMAYMTELPFYDAVYVTKYDGLGWTAPVNITPQIQSDGDHYVSSLSFDGTQLLLTREDAFNSDIYVSNFRNGSWSKAEPLAGQDINTKYWESHASISRDGKKLFFTSNRKDGLGEMDIYKSQLLENGAWSQPVNIGGVINTVLNEDTPFITENDSVLYFSSQGHETMGGYDIFRSKMDAAGLYTRPENIGYPLNTTDDDLFYYPWHNARIGYISRIQNGGFGKEDVYAVLPADDLPLTELLSSLVKTEEPAEAAPVSQPQEVAVTGAVTVPLTPSPAPVITPELQEEPSEQQPVETLQPQAPATVALVPVYFAFDNFQLTEAGKTQLGKVITLLKDFPDVKVKLLGHADAKGPAEYNLKLSEKRALAVKQYLIDQGIDPLRLTSVGLGEKNFAAVNSNPDGTDNPEGRRLNRRVEYEMISSGVRAIVITTPPVPEALRFKE